MFNDEWMREKGFFDKSGLTARDLVASGLSGELRAVGGRAGVHHDGDLAQVAQPLERLPAVELGHPHVEHHEVRAHLVEAPQPAPAVLGRDHLMAGALELHAQDEGEVRRVVDDQDASHLHMMWSRL